MMNNAVENEAYPLAQENLIDSMICSDPDNLGRLVEIYMKEVLPETGMHIRYDMNKCMDCLNQEPTTGITNCITGESNLATLRDIGNFICDLLDKDGFEYERPEISEDSVPSPQTIGTELIAESNDGRVFIPHEFIRILDGKLVDMSCADHKCNKCSMTDAEPEHYKRYPTL